MGSLTHASALVRIARLGSDSAVRQFHLRSLRLGIGFLLDPLDFTFNIHLRSRLGRFSRCALFSLLSLFSRFHFLNLNLAADRFRLLLDGELAENAGALSGGFRLAVIDDDA